MLSGYPPAIVNSCGCDLRVTPASAGVTGGWADSSTVHRKHLFHQDFCRVDRLNCVLRTQSLLYQMELTKGKETGGSSPFMSIGPPLVPWSGDGASFAEKVNLAAVRLPGRRGPSRLSLCPYLPL